MSGASFQNGEQKHRILIEFPATNFIMTQINLHPIDAISYPETPDNFSVATLTDSVGNTNYANTPNNNGGLVGVYQLQLSKLLGLPDMVPCSMGGTGWGNPGTGQPFIYRIARLQALNAYRTLKYIFQASFNDYNFLSQLPTTANALLTSLRAKFPTAMIIVEGPHGGGGTPLTTSQAIEAAVQPVVAALQAAGDGLLFYLPSTLSSLGVPQPWIYGTGNTGAPANNGNADTCIGTDGVHPSGDGSLQRARRIMNTLFQVIANVA
jgi:hypothetical protein